MNWGMISYEIPLQRYPNTYNGQPLSYAALASQKNYCSLYLMCIYADSDFKAWFRDKFRLAGKKLDMGKSCVCFRKIDDLPLKVVGEAIAGMTVEDFITMYEASRKKETARIAF